MKRIGAVLILAGSVVMAIGFRFWHRPSLGWFDLVWRWADIHEGGSYATLLSNELHTSPFPVFSVFVVGLLGLSIPKSRFVQVCSLLVCAFWPIAVMASRGVEENLLVIGSGIGVFGALVMMVVPEKDPGPQR